MSIEKFQDLDVTHYNHDLSSAKHPKIVCFHGLFEGADYFEPLSHRVNSEIVSISLPGHCVGGSITKLRFEGLDHYLSIVGRFLSESISGPFSILGHSLGGVIGALLPPECLGERGRVYFNVEGNVVPSDCVLSRKISQQKREEFCDELCRNGAVNDEKGNREIRGPQIHRLCQEIVERVDGESVLTAYRAYPIKQIYLAGSNSANPDGIDAVRQTGLQVQMVEGAGHDLIRSHPDDVIEVLTEYIGKR